MKILLFLRTLVATVLPLAASQKKELKSLIFL
jgi:hypothetical protein